MKIFVTVGTQVHKFDRLFQMIEEADFTAKYTIQTGTSNYKNPKYNCQKYVNDFDVEVKNADLIICHGGVGSILSALNYNKRVIAVPRQECFGEHVNNHQNEICKEFSQNKNILMAESANELREKLNMIDQFKPCKYESNNERFIMQLEGIIEELC